MLLVVADFVGMSEASACKIITEVTQAIASLRPRLVSMPSTPEQITQTQISFYRIASFPKIIGAIDCSHVDIESPGGENAEYYRCRKGWFSWNVQTICDSDRRILDIVARWPGSTHDQTIFNNSAVKRKFVSGQFGDAILLGDRGYAATDYLMTPVLNPQTPQEMLYESHIRIRNPIECYEIWKRRFPILSLCMRVSLERSQNIIVAIVEFMYLLTHVTEVSYKLRQYLP
ncbi:putative nuclease HARBI1 [Zophobas morio]|uniref:putative nuclease HARBI1 n=1 Tax=Zophobas morio TaxID=2755281 RepID=UPI0030830BC8